MTRKLLVCMVAVAMTGCGVGALEDGPVDEASASRADFEVAAAPVTTLTFDQAWNETASGPIVAGGKVAVDFDATRLPNCRAYHNGNPGWQIFAYLRFQPSGQTVEQGLFTYKYGPTGPDYYSWIKTIPQVDVPEGTTGIEAWFKNGSGFDRPCTEWDSNYGHNYSFAVQPAPVNALGTMVFQSDWKNLLGGKIARGGKLQITYAPERMKSIVSNAKASNGTGMGYFAAKYHCYGYGCCSFENNNSVHVRFNSNEAYATYPIGDTYVEVDVPANASTIEIYFDSDVYTTTWYCGGAEGQKYKQPNPDRFYDSNYGYNFVYTLP